MKSNKDNDSKRGANAKGGRRPDGASESNLGKGTKEKGSGADLASTDMEIPNPS